MYQEPAFVAEWDRSRARCADDTIYCLPCPNLMCSQSDDMCFEHSQESWHIKGRIHVEERTDLGVKEGRAAVGRHPDLASEACQVA